MENEVTDIGVRSSCEAQDSDADIVEPMMERVSSAMRCLQLGIEARFGKESDQYDAFLTAAENVEELIDAIPGMRIACAAPRGAYERPDAVQHSQSVAASR